jgi:hypothetical protein
LLRAVTSFSFESGHWSDNMTNGTCERAGQTCTHDPDNLFYNSHHGLVCFDRLTIEGAMELRGTWLYYFYSFRVFDQKKIYIHVNILCSSLRALDSRCR